MVMESPDICQIGWWIILQIKIFQFKCRLRTGSYSKFKPFEMYLYTEIYVSSSGYHGLFKELATPRYSMLHFLSYFTYFIT